MPDPDYDNAQWMREIGAAGGRANAAKRFDSIDFATRRLIAVKAARARWKKAQWSKAEEEAYLEGWKAGLEHGTGWERRGRKPKAAATQPEPTDGALVAVDPVVESTPDTESLGRGELISALESTEEGKYTKFLTALSSPRYQNWNVATLARRFGITPHELATIWRNHNLMKATMTIIEGLPKTAAAVVEDAQSVYEMCPRCHGFRYVEVPIYLQDLLEAKVISCSSCGGLGTVRVPGSNADRNRMWQAAGWNNNHQGPAVQVNVNQPAFSAASVIEEIEKAGRK